MLDSTKTILNNIIIKQEGGWVLTENANDPDGGWTYGGMTKKTFCAANPGWDGYDCKQMQDLINIANGDTKGRDRVQTVVLYTYEREFVIPSKVESLPGPLQSVYLSAAINLGVTEAVKLIQQACNEWVYPHQLIVDGIMGTQTINEIFTCETNETESPNLKDDFCHQWRLFYAHLVVAEPTERLGFLVGWLNRIEEARNI